MSIEIFERELNGKKISFTSENVFEVQVGKGKSKYHTKYKFKGDLNRAILHYRAINIGLGYKKRLVCWELNPPILARVIS